MAATPEIHPVARAGFGVAAEAYERGRPGYPPGGWDQELDEDGLVDRILSTSYVAALAAERRAAIEAEIRSFVAGFPATIRLPHLTDVY